MEGLEGFLATQIYCAFYLLVSLFTIKISLRIFNSKLNSFNKRTILKLSFEHLPIGKNDLTLTVQIMIHEVTLVKPLAINISSETIYLVRAVL